MRSFVIMSLIYEYMIITIPFLITCVDQTFMEGSVRENLCIRW
jgi:hypothetical protein